MADLSFVGGGTDSDGAPSGQFGVESPAAAAAAASAPPNATLLDLSILVAYLRRMVPAAMEPDGSLLESFRELLLKEESLEMLRRFISDPQFKVLYVQRLLVKGMCFYYFYDFFKYLI